MDLPPRDVVTFVTFVYSIIQAEEERQILYSPFPHHPTTLPTVGGSGIGDIWTVTR